MSKYYDKNKIIYEKFVDAEPLNKNMPKQFAVIKTSGNGCFCGYYALNIGLGMCDRKTNQNAIDIKNDFKKFANNMGNQNTIVVMSRRSNNKNWHVTNNNVINTVMKGEINNEGKGFFNRYRAGERNKYLSWVEESFWLWACNKYEVEINILFESKGNTWTCYKPISNNNQNCKIYIHARGQRHYSAMEPLNNISINEGLPLGREIKNNKIRAMYGTEYKKRMEKAIKESIESKENENQFKKVMRDSLKTAFKEYLEKGNINGINNLLSNANNNFKLTDKEKTRLIGLLRKYVIKKKIGCNQLKKYRHIIKFLSNDKKYVGRIINDKDVFLRLLNRNFLETLDACNLLNDSNLNKFSRLALTEGKNERHKFISNLQKMYNNEKIKNNLIFAKQHKNRNKGVNNYKKGTMTYIDENFKPARRLVEGPNKFKVILTKAGEGDPHPALQIGLGMCGIKYKKNNIKVSTYKRSSNRKCKIYNLNGDLFRQVSEKFNVHICIYDPRNCAWIEFIPSRNANGSCKVYLGFFKEYFLPMEPIITPANRS